MLALKKRHVAASVNVLRTSPLTLSMAFKPYKDLSARVWVDIKQLMWTISRLEPMFHPSLARPSGFARIHAGLYFAESVRLVLRVTSSSYRALRSETEVYS